MSRKLFAMATVRRTCDAFTLKQRGCASGPCHAPLASRVGGFTLVELLVSVFVLAIIILMVGQLMTSATAITKTGNKHASQPKNTSQIVSLPLLMKDRWPAATDGTTADLDRQYETIGPGVFRFEYYYLLKTGKVTDIPWNTDSRENWPVHTSMAGIGLGDVESMTVGIAVIDSAGRALIDAANSGSLDDLASDMADFRTSPGRGVGGQPTIGALEASWQTSLLTDLGKGRTR